MGRYVPFLGAAHIDRALAGASSRCGVSPGIPKNDLVLLRRVRNDVPASQQVGYTG
jgi:hypothetical protein